MALYGTAIGVSSVGYCNSARFTGLTHWRCLEKLWPLSADVEIELVSRVNHSW
jgi:hypothetical protein